MLALGFLVGVRSGEYNAGLDLLIRAHPPGSITHLQLQTASL